MGQIHYFSCLFEGFILSDRYLRILHSYLSLSEIKATISTVRKWALASLDIQCNNYRLLNVYCEIFGTSSYGKELAI